MTGLTNLLGRVEKFMMTGTIDVLEGIMTGITTCLKSNNDRDKNQPVGKEKMTGTPIVRVKVSGDYSDLPNRDTNL
jgi:hypothetical protein